MCTTYFGLYLGHPQARMAQFYENNPVLCSTE